VNRIRLLIILGVIALALPFGMGAARATGTPPANEVIIQPDAQYDLLGNIIHVGLRVRCKAGTLPGTPGQVDVVVEQFPPETPYPVAEGSGLNNVVCDGRTRTVGVSILGVGFDAGRAKATATLIPPLGAGGMVTTKRTINIVVMNP
jgi:hypothetical protein